MLKVTMYVMHLLLACTSTLAATTNQRRMTHGNSKLSYHLWHWFMEALALISSLRMSTISASC